MLAESLVYARSFWPTPRGFRHHLVDAVGLWSRGERHRTAWAPHLERTGAAIEAAMETTKSRRTVAVLGAGPLFDVPVEALARSFERVLLVDIAHLAPARRRIAPHANVECLWRDLAPEEEPQPLGFLGEIPDLDWVISVNLLSQIGRAAPDGREREAIDRHLDGLAGLAAPVTLVTDTSYRVLDRRGAILEETDLLHGRPLPPSDDAWEWEVAPLGEEARDRRRLHRVVAYARWPSSHLGSFTAFV